MSVQEHGVGLSWGIRSGMVTVGGLFQTRDHTIGAEKDIVRDGNGDPAAVTYYGSYQQATFEYVVTGSGPSSSSAAVIPTQGTITSIADSVYTQIVGSNWLVDSIDTKTTSTTALRVTLKLSAYPNITS